MRIPVDTYLETARCLMRYPLAQDTERLLSAFTAREFPKDVPLGQLHTAGQVDEWIAGCQRRWATGRGYTWTAERKADRVVVGQVSVMALDDPGAWSVAYWTHPDCWGQGYATEMLRRAIDFAFERLEAGRIWAAAGARNEASLQVLRKGGLRFLGENPAGYQLDGQPVATREYGLTRSEWQETCHPEEKKD